MWRNWVMERAGKDFEALKDNIADQAEFAQALNKFITDLALSDVDAEEDLEANADGEGEEDENETETEDQN
jgi:cobalamin biosynthesis protein CobT